MNYNDVGVDIDLTNMMLSRLKPKFISPIFFNHNYMIENNDYCAVVSHKDDEKVKYVYSVDGVGSKLLLATKFPHIYSNVARDLFAMVFNDIICSGATPLFLLDYYATHSIRELHNKNNRFELIIRNLQYLCETYSVGIIGGETAEVPGLYSRKKFDLVGFGIGAVTEDNLITPKKVKENDVIIGLHSSGPHSNGYTLLNKLVKKNPHVDEKFIMNILHPSSLYIDTIEFIKDFDIDIHGLAHITGGGIDNISRVIPSDLKMNIDFSQWGIPDLFKEIQGQLNMTEKELRRTFNCGIGMAIIISPDDVNPILEILPRSAKVIGTVVKNE